MEPLESQPQFTAWHIVLLLLLLFLTTVGEPIATWLFPGLEQAFHSTSLQILMPLCGLGLIVLLFEQWGVIRLKTVLMNTGLTLPLIASFALLYPLLSYF